jgi:nitrile hydratase
MSSADLGGEPGFGPVAIERDEPVFHSDWERRMFGLTMLAVGKGLVTVDGFRWGIERIPREQYLAQSYYERWIASLERNMIEQGLLEEGELEARARELAESGDEAPVHEDPQFTEWFMQLVKTAGSPAVEPEGEPRFAVGDAVRTRDVEPRGHTRLPRYARGKPGRVERIQGCYLFPDRRALREGDEPQWVYCVRFDARELWGERAEPNEVLYLDLWERYLEGA